MTLLKQIVEGVGVIAVIAVFCWLKYFQVKDHTTFSGDKGPQKLFESDDTER